MFSALLGLGFGAFGLYAASPMGSDTSAWQIDTVFVLLATLGGCQFLSILAVYISSFYRNSVWVSILLFLHGILVAADCLLTVFLFSTTVRSQVYKLADSTREQELRFFASRHATVGLDGFDKWQIWTIGGAFFFQLLVYMYAIAFRLLKVRERRSRLHASAPKTADSGLSAAMNRVGATPDSVVSEEAGVASSDSRAGSPVAEGTGPTPTAAIVPDQSSEGSVKADTTAAVQPGVPQRTGSADASRSSGTSGAKVGVGLFFATRPMGGLQVSQFVDGGPAQRSGLIREGDVITGVDGVDVFGLPQSDLAKYLLGEPGTPVRITFQRPQAGQSYEVALERGAPSIATQSTGRAGVGLSVITASDGQLVVSALVPGGSAAKSGSVQAGDAVVAVDGVSVLNQPEAIFQRLILGAPGSMVRLTLQRGDQRHVAQLERQDTVTQDASQAGDIAITLKPAFEGALYVVEVRATDAQSGGVEVGDCLHTVDGASVYRRPLPEVRAMLRGPVGTSVRMGFRKGTADSLHEVLLARRPMADSAEQADQPGATAVGAATAAIAPQQQEQQQPADTVDDDTLEQQRRYQQELIEQQRELQKQLEELQAAGQVQLLQLQHSLEVEQANNTAGQPALQQRPSLSPQPSIIQPASVNLPGAQPEPVQAEPASRLYGVGIYFNPDPYGGLAVLSFVPGGPAQRSGQIVPGDVIASVDDDNVYGKPLSELAKYLLGPKGSQVVLGFQRSDDPSKRVRRVNIIRGASEEDRKVPPANSGSGQPHQPLVSQDAVSIPMQHIAAQQGPQVASNVVESSMGVGQFNRWHAALQPLGLVLEQSRDGLSVSNIVEGGPVWLTQAVESGDVILAVNGADVVSAEPTAGLARQPVRMSVRKRRGGRVVHLVVQRGAVMV